MKRGLFLSTIFIFGITSTVKVYACGEKKLPVKAEAQEAKLVLPVIASDKTQLALRQIRSTNETKPVEKSSEAEK